MEIGVKHLDRLTHWSGFSTNQGYGYDASGNRLYLTIGANTYAYTTPASSNRLAAAAGPATACSASATTPPGGLPASPGAR